jgi:uncharacterized membrane protein
MVGRAALRHLRQPPIRPLPLLLPRRHLPPQPHLLQRPALPLRNKGFLVISALRTWLLAGLLVLVPLMITVAVLNWVVSTLDETLRILPAQWQPEVLLGFYIPGLGVLFALIILLLIGAATSNFIGKKLVNWWDGLLNRIPVVRSVYAAVKQVSDTLFSNKGNAFRKALLIQWPREGLWTVAFLTGKPGSTVNNQLGDGYISVYVPTTPNPTSGYMMLVREIDCKPLDMSVDEALTYVISMGVIVPPDHKALKAPHEPLTALKDSE